MNEISSRAFAVADGEGRATWFAGALMVEKAAGGGFDLLDQTVPPDYSPPRHVHRHEDEAWYLLEGEATFWCGEQTLQAERGGFVFLPRGVEHCFKIGPSGARLLTFTFPSGFARFVEEAGRPAAELRVPDPEPPDPARLGAIAAGHGIDITGPPA
ncbi:MAG TPA: cupin domain-containing protein [Candidatus Dormibacteraeota bacterium]